MQEIKDIELVLDGDFWTHDVIIHEQIISRINEPIVITDINGCKYLPATIVYIKDKLGDRKFNGISYKRDLIDYVRDIDKLKIKGLSGYLLKDPVSNTVIIGIPLKDSVFIKADESLKEIIASNQYFSSALNKLVSHFQQYQFGIIGSTQLGLNGEGSDLDLCIYGNDNFFKVLNEISKPKVQKCLGIETQGIDRVIKNALKYQERYKIDLSLAKKFSELRARFTLRLDDNHSINIGLNGNHLNQLHNGATILKSKKIREVEIIGKVTNIVNSCCFPREYEVLSKNKIIKIISHHWGHQLMVKNGDLVKVSGILREMINGEEVIFLEDDKVCFLPKKSHLK